MADIEVPSAVDKLLESCKGRLGPDTFKVVKLHRHVLIEKQIINEEVIKILSVKELIDCGLSPGAAAGLKAAAAGGGAAGGATAANAAMVSSLQEASLADYSEKLNEVLRLTRITSRTVGHLCSQRVQSYVDPSSTNSSTSHQDRFRKSVADHYGYEDATGSPQICMLTGCKHDWHDLVAGHIVPRSQASNARVDVKLPNIDDPCNGIFWSRAVEGAWSAGIFCFSFPGHGVFKFNLLDETYSTRRVKDWPLGSRPLKSSTNRELGDLTWGDLHATGQLQFPPGQCSRPYRRALCFMSRMLLINSRLQSVPRPDDVDSEASEFDYMSEDAKVATTIAWIEDVRHSLVHEDVPKMGDWG